ncbi:MAG: GNAT family N-acetyltransferase [Romboutsia sp.]
MKIRYAEENDIDDIKDIWRYCFNDGEKFMNYYFENKYSRLNTVVVDEREEIVSSLQLNQYKIFLNNKVYDTSYIVGVSTFPQVRGRGYMQNIMNFTLEELYKKNQLVSILMPIDYRLYRKYGYEHCYDQIEYKIDIEDLSKFKINGRLYKISDKHIKDLIHIQRCFLQDVNGNVVRNEIYYKNLFEEVKSEDGYMYIHKNNGYEGYIIYSIHGDTMMAREIFYKNIESLKSMLKFIYNHNTQCKRVIISAPIMDKVRHILDNPKTCEIKIKPFMMGRIINLKGYLESLDIDYDIEGSTKIMIEDKFILENNGVFKINAHKGRLYVDNVDESYDMAFDINTITQIAFSYINLSEAFVLNNIDGDKVNKDSVSLFNSIFKKKDNYINEYV